MSEDRRERIGRAAYIASMKAWSGVVRGFSEILWDNVVQDRKEQWTNEALAAVAEARRIDTCETCKWEYQSKCAVRCNHPDPLCCYNKYGCNRHEPKEARRIDTCDTCRLYGDGMSCKIINAVDPNCQLRTCEFGCNRHEPKEGE